jgi:cellobiose phosphorylase
MTPPSTTSGSRKGRSRSRAGPGLFLRLVVECLLGIRRRSHTVEIDPVLPPSLDGLTATVPLDGRALTVTFSVGPLGHGPTSVSLNDVPLLTTTLTNPYRRPGVSVDLDQLRAARRDEPGTLHVVTS